MASHLLGIERNRVRAVALLSLSAIAAAHSAPGVAAVDQLIYVSLAQPCRLLDTRSPGPGALTAAHGTYLLGSSNADIESPGQNGNAAGCAIPAGVSAISVNFNMFDATAAGNILTWASGATKPTSGTAVYNPSVVSPMAGQVDFNSGFATIAVGASDTRFNLAVANGQIDMTINVVGYWTALSTSAVNSGLYATTWGQFNVASGNSSTAGGVSNKAIAPSSTAIGQGNSANGIYSTAIGVDNTATGIGAVAVGDSNTASGPDSVALGSANTASGSASVALGNGADSISHGGSFAFGDGSLANTADKQFMVRASGGFVFYTSNNLTAGLQVVAGGGSWTALSDRNAKKSIRPIDGRDVLDRVVAMPLATWQYKTQDAKYRHMGPMAQDFYAAFGLGESDTGIDTIDADGVALAAIQGLNAKLERENASLKADLADLKAAVKSLQRDHIAIVTPDATP